MIPSERQQRKWQKECQKHSLSKYDKSFCHQCLHFRNILVAKYRNELAENARNFQNQHGKLPFWNQSLSHRFK